MKKILLIILSFIIFLTFVSCGKEKIETVEESSSSVSNTLFDLMPSRTEANSQNEANLEYKRKKVKEVKLDSGLGIKINFDAETLKAFETAENDETVPDAKLIANCGTIKIFYADDTVESIGTIYLGSDSALYLKFSNSKNKDAAYKFVEVRF